MISFYLLATTAAAFVYILLVFMPWIIECLIAMPYKKPVSFEESKMMRKFPLGRYTYPVKTGVGYTKKGNIGFITNKERHTQVYQYIWSFGIVFILIVNLIATWCPHASL